MDFGKEYLDAVQSIGRGVASTLRKKVGNYDELVTSSNQLKLAKSFSEQLYRSREVLTDPAEWKRKKQLLFNAFKKIWESVTDAVAFAPSLSVTQFTDEHFYPEEDSEVEGEHLPEDKNEKEIEFFLKEKINNSEDLPVFWKENRKKYPRLALLARNVLSVQTSNVSSEMVLNHARKIVTIVEVLKEE
eukprot:augustus_masked-scaffold_34-processed-gene-3.6-mRNA-1 protein AED:0.34 eAED:0.34 QI:0/-1/0/1/-1/1/1/0/187